MQLGSTFNCMVVRESVCNLKLPFLAPNRHDKTITLALPNVCVQFYRVNSVQGLSVNNTHTIQPLLNGCPRGYG